MPAQAPAALPAGSIVAAILILLWLTAWAIQAALSRAALRKSEGLESAATWRRQILLRRLVHVVHVPLLSIVCAFAVATMCHDRFGLQWMATVLWDQLPPREFVVLLELPSVPPWAQHKIEQDLGGLSSWTVLMVETAAERLTLDEHRGMFITALALRGAAALMLVMTILSSAHSAVRLWQIPPFDARATYGLGAGATPAAVARTAR